MLDVTLSRVPGSNDGSPRFSPMNVRKRVDISMERKSSQDSSVGRDKADSPDFENFVNPEMALLYTNREDHIQTQKLSTISHEGGEGHFASLKYKTVDRNTPDRY